MIIHICMGGRLEGFRGWVILSIRVWSCCEDSIKAGDGEEWSSNETGTESKMGEALG